MILNVKRAVDVHAAGEVIVHDVGVEAARKGLRPGGTANGRRDVDRLTNSALLAETLADLRHGSQAAEG